MKTGNAEFQGGFGLNFYYADNEDAVNYASLNPPVSMVYLVHTNWISTPGFQYFTHTLENPASVPNKIMIIKNQTVTFGGSIQAIDLTLNSHDGSSVIVPKDSASAVSSLLIKNAASATFHSHGGKWVEIFGYVSSPKLDS